MTCKMRMKNVGGIKEADVIDGVKFGGILDILFADDTTVLTY
ncbi:MAG: hypothetical protein QNK15_07785 [Cycloclasticus sp.]|nr:hypothetical protein [Cycloclasticus sp.]